MTTYLLVAVILLLLYQNYKLAQSIRKVRTDLYVADIEVLIMVTKHLKDFVTFKERLEDLTYEEIETEVMDVYCTLVPAAGDLLSYVKRETEAEDEGDNDSDRTTH